MFLGKIAISDLERIGNMLKRCEAQPYEFYGYRRQFVKEDYYD